MMIDDKLARIRSTVNNIRRYRRLLETQLTEAERQFIERRLSEERATLQTLQAETFPMAFRLPQVRAGACASSSMRWRMVNRVLDFLIQGHQKVIGHYKFLLSSNGLS